MDQLLYNCAKGETLMCSICDEIEELREEAIEAYSDGDIETGIDAMLELQDLTKSKELQEPEWMKVRWSHPNLSLDDKIVKDCFEIYFDFLRWRVRSEQHCVLEFEQTRR